MQDMSRRLRNGRPREDARPPTHDPIWAEKHGTRPTGTPGLSRTHVYKPPRRPGESAAPDPCRVPPDGVITRTLTAKEDAAIRDACFQAVAANRLPDLFQAAPESVQQEWWAAVEQFRTNDLYRSILNVLITKERTRQGMVLP